LHQLLKSAIRDGVKSVDAIFLLELKSKPMCICNDSGGVIHSEDKDPAQAVEKTYRYADAQSKPELTLSPTIIVTMRRDPDLICRHDENRSDPSREKAAFG